MQILPANHCKTDGVGIQNIAIVLGGFTKRLLDNAWKKPHNDSVSFCRTRAGCHAFSRYVETQGSKQNRGVQALSGKPKAVARIPPIIE